jgi:C_GCAxxG_C_C family probable redox protein
MSDKVKGAVEMYRDTGFNCAQSVLSEFAPQLGMDRETAMRVACGLGSGMGRSGNMCGAVTGGMLVLGLKFGMVDPDGTEDKEKTYDQVLQLLDRVMAIHGSANCAEIMGVDIGTPEGQQEAKDRDLSDKVCAKVVEDVARILEELLEDGP